jgi:hypothetical protein
MGKVKNIYESFDEVFFDKVFFQKDFCDDAEKMVDFFQLSKREFLESYSYLTEEEYLLTLNRVGMDRVDTPI